MVAIMAVVHSLLQSATGHLGTGQDGASTSLFVEVAQLVESGPLGAVVV